MKRPQGIMWNRERTPVSAHDENGHFSRNQSDALNQIKMLGNEETTLLRQLQPVTAYLRMPVMLTAVCRTLTTHHTCGI